jgi:hypothetical protein
MTALVLRPTLSLALVETLFARNRVLASFGAACLLLVVPATAMNAIDPAQLPSGASPWVKPAKFFASVGLFALTSAWFFGYVRPERRDSRAMRWTAAILVAAASFELFWISWQAAHGVDSHFNAARPIDLIMFQLMGVFALVLTATTLPLAWEIARRPAPGLSRDYVAAVAIGLVSTFLLGSVAGMAMGINNGHAVGPEGQPLPLFGWNGLGGDLRPAHFLGIHAEQLIPAGAALVGGLAARTRRALVIGGTIAYVALFAALLGQALAGRPLIPAPDPSVEPRAVGHRPLGLDEHDGAAGIGKAEGQNFRHERSNLPRREVDHRRHLPPDELVGRIMDGDLRA